MPSRIPNWYTATLNRATGFPPLQGDLRVDVAIVGGGLTGVAAAVELSERGYRVALLEANEIGWGASGRNGGQVTGSLSGDRAIRAQLRNVLGAAADDYVWDLRWRGHRIIRERIARYGINCDLKSGHLHAAYKPSHVAELEAMFVEGSRRGMGEQLRLLSRQEIPDYVGTDLYHGGLLNRYNLHLHSLNLCVGEALAAVGLGAQVFEHSGVERIEHGATPIVRTRDGRVQADAVLLAGNAYHRLERRQLGGLLFPASLGNLVTAKLEPTLAQTIMPADVAVYDTRFVLDYYRLTSDHRLMFGSGTNYHGRDATDVASQLRPALETTFPQLRGVAIDYAWSGMAGITLNRIPGIGRLSANVYFAQGYSGHGIATSHVVAEMVTNAIAGSAEEFDRFSRLKSIRVPLGDRAGQWLLTLGMYYYRFIERFR